ncbi:hypothetical protein PsYK624_045300 [Phanerochaete sordida]|uniref:Arrestin-like N-terminal domain-containing protein n=1 Tax=Phanerochaete sordida TaxID=48140 RepID=A0A9P3G3J0_9APHY|nr:hypothetical protein PsYK624_045300 [Phanerochaete sordida]
MGKDELEAVNLLFDPRLHVSGEFVEGAVDLYFPKLMEDNIEEVHIKLRGSIMTKVTKQLPGPPGQPPRQITHRNQVDLCRENISLWQKGSTLYPQPGSHVLRLPFRFALPPRLPPSCSYSGFHWEGTVGYFLEAVGERHGLHFNRRTQIAFPVLPAEPRGANLRSVLSLGWNGGWKTLEARDEIRRGIWGDYAQVQAILIFPDMEAFPVLTPIPLTLNVVTVSKTMKADEHKEDEEIFPEPPQNPKKYELKMESKIWVKAQGHTNGSSDHTVGYLAGFGESDDPHFSDAVQVQGLRKTWIPSHDSHDEKKHKGQWKQEVTFRSSFVLNCPPSFSTDTMTVEYNARLKIDFPGIGNDTKLDFVMPVISSMPPPGQPWQGPPPQLDLPPGYFDASSWANGDEKN